MSSAFSDSSCAFRCRCAVSSSLTRTSTDWTSSISAWNSWTRFASRAASSLLTSSSFCKKQCWLLRRCSRNSIQVFAHLKGLQFRVHLLDVAIMVLRIDLQFLSQINLFRFQLDVGFAECGDFFFETLFHRLEQLRFCLEQLDPFRLSAQFFSIGFKCVLQVQNVHSNGYLKMRSCIEILPTLISAIFDSICLT